MKITYVENGLKFILKSHLSISLIWCMHGKEIFCLHANRCTIQKYFACDSLWQETAILSKL